MKSQEKIAIIYHKIFSYVLSKDELQKWIAGPKLVLREPKGQHFSGQIKFVTSLPKTIDLVNEKKLKIARSAAKVLEKIPTVLFVGITGSLAMQNAKPHSDIDFMIITKKDALWLTRFLSIFVLTLSGYKLRRARNKDERDKICLNYWIDETALAWAGSKNAYIAHEIAQVVPLVNKTHIYEEWILNNVWTKDYWPKATINIRKKDAERHKKQSLSVLYIVNLFFFLLQKIYMSTKITRETVDLNKALFHPYDWSEKVLLSLSKMGVGESVK